MWWWPYSPGEAMIFRAERSSLHAADRCWWWFASHVCTAAASQGTGSTPAMESHSRSLLLLHPVQFIHDSSSNCTFAILPLHSNGNRDRGKHWPAAIWELPLSSRYPLRLEWRHTATEVQLDSWNRTQSLFNIWIFYSCFLISTSWIYRSSCWMMNIKRFSQV